MKTVERARGRWRHILPALGIDSRYLVNRHGPCPLCGGRDRFRWDDREGSGSYFCGQCGPGPGLLLLQKLHGWTYAEACAEVDRIIGTEAPAQRSGAQICAPGSADRRRAAVERALAGATDRNLVIEYLNSRGLRCLSEVLQGHPALPYHDGGQFLGNFPAVLAPVTGPDGSLQSAHRIYLGDVPTRKKLMPPVATVRGAAARLFDHSHELGIAEGIETAIAAHETHRLPVWAAITAGGLETFNPPHGVRRLVILGDNDSSFTGQKAAYALAHRMHRDRPEIDVEVAIPTQPDSDWLDVLTGDAPA